MPETKGLSARVKMIRKSMAMSQTAFAAEVGISVEELSLIERYKTDVKLSTLQKIAAYTGKTVAELLEVERK